jgi:hypothetical protein
MSLLSEQAIGALILLLIVADIVLTFLYGRIGTGILGGYLASLAWRLFLWLSTRFGRYGAKVLSLCGPIIVSLVVFTWTFALMGGAALVFHIKLGKTVRATTGPTLSALMPDGQQRPKHP